MLGFQARRKKSIASEEERRRSSASSWRSQVSLAETTVDEIAAEAFKAEAPLTPDLDEAENSEEIGQEGEPQAAVVLPSYYGGNLAIMDAQFSDEQTSTVASDDNTARAKRKGKDEKKAKKVKDVGQMQKKAAKASAAPKLPAGRGAASGPYSGL